MIKNSSCTVHYYMDTESTFDFVDTVMDIFDDCGWKPDEKRTRSPEPLSSIISINAKRKEVIIELSLDLIDTKNPCQWYTTMIKALESKYLNSGKIINIHLKNPKDTFLKPASILSIRKKWEITKGIFSSYRLSNTLKNRNWREEAYLSWMGGIDIVKEAHDNKNKNEFTEKIQMFKTERDNCSSRTKKKKIFIPHLSSPWTKDLMKQLKICHALDVNTVEINLESLGMATSISLIKKAHELGILVMGRLSQKNSIMSLEASIWWWRMIGLDIISNLPIRQNQPFQTLSSKKHPNSDLVGFYNGNITPGSVEGISKKYGYNLGVETHDSIINHPYGIKAGADALQFAVSCSSKGINMNEVQHKNENYTRSLREWNQDLIKNHWTRSKQMISSP